MNTSYTIYFGNKPYYIVQDLSKELMDLAHVAGTIMVNHPDEIMVGKAIRDMDLPGTGSVIILTNRVEFFWEIFQKHFISIVAGGGIVTNEKNEVLFIYRRGKWDLPKGKLDDGETIETCAVREVKEETGLKMVEITGRIGNTYHTYHERGKHILKTTTWFSMKAPGAQMLTPQLEEDILEMAWLPEDEWGKVFKNTYPLIPIILHQSRA